jgi:hypothetical protein
MMIRFDDIKVYQVSPAARIVHWLLTPTNEDLTDLTVDVYRSYSPTQDFEKIASVAYPTTYYRDAEVNVTSFWREAYYRVTAVFQGEAYESPVHGLNSAFAAIAKEMIRRTDVLLRFAGVPAMVYLRRLGERCPDCWDSVMQKVTTSKCLTCFATSYRGGYYDPILTLINIVPERKTDQPDVSLRQPTQTSFKMSNCPILRPADVIYEVNQGSRWRVDDITPSEIERVTTVQDFIATRLVATDIAHKLPIPDDLVPSIIPVRSHRIRKRYKYLGKESGPPERIPLWR